MNLLLVKTTTEGHPYSQFVDALQQALRELGHGATVSNQTGFIFGASVNPSHLAKQIAGGKFDAVVSFSFIFGGVTLNTGASMFDVMGVKFLGWQLDHPVYISQ